MKNLLIRVSMVVALLAAGLTAFAQTTVRGTVKDAAGNGVVGASVFVQGTHNGTIAELDGSYVLSNAKVGDKIEFSCIGYASQVVTWNGGPLNVVLDEDSELLEGTVVTALGIRKDEKRVGYAVSSINAETLNNTVSPSLGSALYGKASGVRVTTAPGGATGAISINVRGISSITGTSQPLVVVDGVPVRNGDANNSDYWSDQRVNSNGLTDINVEDIENLTILKGASATSLYGSEGANGVVLITMKQGKKNSGVHVDFNASIQADQVAYMPTYQTTFGPGYPYAFWYLGLEEDIDSPNYGFLKNPRKDRDGKETYGPQNSYYYFGPKYDGREVYTPTGYRPYSPVTSNPWSDVFRTGITQQYNVAVQQGGEHGHFRFSYTFMDNTPNQYNSHLGKHNFQVSGSQDVTSNGAVKLGYSVNYMNQNVKNRPYRTSRLVTNYGGMFGSFDPVGVYRDRTVTAAGYQNRVYTSNTHENPAEGWEYSPAVSALIGEYFWNILGKEQLENNNRLIASVTPSWMITKGLTLKGSIATDYTTQKQENKDYAGTNAALAGSYQGGYSIAHREYTTIYGDALLNWDKDITDVLNLNANIGWSARREMYSATSTGTRGGLTVENWFNFAASAEKTNNASMGYSDFLKQAVFGTVALSYKDWAYLEGTLRNEKTSTLRNQSYWYPSVNASIIFSELLNLPAWVDYGKFRVSYGEVGNAPALYKAPLSYSQSTASGYVYNQLGMNIGNDSIRPERTKEWELGLEGKFLNNRAGFEVSWYNKKIVDQILETTVPASSGVTSMLMNIGILQNRGLEVAAYGTPIETRDWRFDISGNIAWNKNKVLQLAEGVERLQHARWDNGAAYLYSYPGETMGDIYAFAPETNDKGEKIVDADGFYKVTSEPVKVGNAMADLIGGFAFALSYKRWTLDMNFNYQIGGTVFNMPYQYMMGLGTLAESMPYRDVEHGGIAYYEHDGQSIRYEGNDRKSATGETVHYDGRILPGVKEDGTPNDKIISQELFLEETYGWGVGGYLFYSHAMFDNTYLKCREITLTYSVPDSLIRKFKCNSLRISAFARNPFYIYKNLPIFDAESTDGTNWTSQVCIGGSTSTSRTYGLSLRVNF